MADRLKTVLLVDSDSAERHRIGELLQAARGVTFLADQADSLAGAIERLQDGGIDAVLLELDLKDSRGLDTLERLQHSAPDIPIVVLSHIAEDVLGMEAARRGAQDYLDKSSVDAHALKRAVCYSIERLRAEHASQLLATAMEASMLLATAVEQSAEAILITDTNGVIQYVNPSFSRITGYSQEEAVGETPRLVRSGRHDDPFYGQLWQTLLRGDVWSGNFINRRKDGTLYRQEATISPVRDSSGKIVNFVLAGRDVTREIELEEQLRQSQKMEAVGQLAGGIAHDFNNLLTAIMGNAELLLANLNEDDPRRGDLDEIRHAGARAARLTRQLLAFSRRQVMEPVILGLNEVVDNVSNLIQRLIGEPIELVTKLDEGLVQVLADPGQIEQVVLNLAVNARDAMPEGGRLLIETANVDLDEEYLGTHARVTPGSYVMLAISDTGVGMDEETRSRIFEPFFTTKASGKGTGLGLSTVYGIIKQSNGYIWVYSEPGRGTTFKIYLPQFGGKEPVERPGLRDMEGEVAVGGETALLVEDDDGVRAVVRRTLQSSGYTVLEARNAAQAERMAREHDGPIDFLVTDLVMPDMSGRELASRIAAYRPLLRVLYMSGYSDNAVLGEGMLTPEMEFLAKPFSQDKLLQKVRRILETPGSDTTI
ncbi:MAG: response regulator [Gemmatimonadota bacterium]|nr:MAG: response regulator [Gemmatimonadota bacterium]